MPPGHDLLQGGPTWFRYGVLCKPESQNPPQTGDSSLIVSETMIFEREFLHTSAQRKQSAAYGKHGCDFFVAGRRHALEYDLALFVGNVEARPGPVFPVFAWMDGGINTGRPA
jgi:hypothetical protein